MIDTPVPKRSRARPRRQPYAPLLSCCVLLALTHSSGADDALDLAAYLTEVRERNPVLESARAQRDGRAIAAGLGILTAGDEVVVNTVLNAPARDQMPNR